MKCTSWKELEPKTVALRTQLLSIISNIEQESQSSKELPQPSGTFEVAKKLIKKPEYNIVVCGEVKKGKSSLLNAIIGRDVLPVDNNIATSQVFRITNSHQESYYLVFTDGSRQAISESELSRYGSQVDAELRGEPIFNGRSLDYIQINIPMEFLPEGVSLVDTPGLGAIHKSHENITQNYLRNAAAVLFIITPDNPIVAQEKEFILKALEVTPYMLFIMTKVDLYDSEVWNAQIERNKETLTPIFKAKQYNTPYILPISSTLLRKADCNTKLSEMYLKKSLFPVVRDELQRMMYKAVGLLRTGFALAECKKQALKTSSTIEDMLRATSAENREEQEAIQREKAELNARMKQEFGESGVQTKALERNISNICIGVKSQVQQLLSGSGSIYNHYSTIIDNITTMDQVEVIVETIGDEIVNDVSSGWQRIVKDANNRVSILVGELENELDYSYFHSSSIKTVELDSHEEFNSYKSEFFNASFVSFAGISLLSLLGFTIAAPITIIGGLLYTFFGGKEKAKRLAVDKNKNALHKSLRDIMNELNSQLIHVRELGSESMVDTFLTNLKSSASRAIHDMLREKKEYQVRLERDLEERSRQNAVERKREIERLNVVRTKWNVISNEVKTIDALHKEINSVLNK